MPPVRSLYAHAMRAIALQRLHQKTNRGDFMRREEIIGICDRHVLDTASHLFGTRKDALKLVAGYEGCANLVYEYNRDGQPRILRISFRPDRTAEQIQAELHFVNYIAAISGSYMSWLRRGKVASAGSCSEVCTTARPLWIIIWNRSWRAITGRTRYLPNGWRVCHCL